MSYGAAPYGRLAYGQGEGEFVLQALAGRTKAAVQAKASLRALAEVGTRARLGLRLAGGGWALAHLGTVAQIVVVGKAQPMGTGSLVGRLRSRVWAKSTQLGGNHVVIALQVVDQGPLVVAGTLTEWVP